MKLKFFELAKKLASFGEHWQHKVGCAIVRKNRIVGLGYNQMKTHTKSTHPFRYLHAEMSAILNSKEDLNGTDIYVFRQHRDGSCAMSKPCQHCEFAIKQAGIKRIYFSTEGGFAEIKI